MDGDAEYSGIKNVKLSSDSNSFVLFPNPSTGNVNISLTTNQIGVGSINIYDSLGKRLFQDSKIFLEGNNQHQIELTDLSAGIYQVELLLNGVSMKKRLVIGGRK